MMMQIASGALCLSLWSAGFQKVYGPVVRVTMERIIE